MPAEPEDLPVGPLRDIGYRVRADTRAMMSTLELRWRAEWVWELENRALSEDPEKAQRTRKLAEKALHSLSDFSYSAEQADLSQRLTDANRRGDSRAAQEALSELRSLQHRHPRLPEERAVAHATAVLAKVAEDLAIPSRRPSRLFDRNKIRK